MTTHENEIRPEILGKCVVTGASGFIGGALVKYLCAFGCEVTGQVRNNPYLWHDSKDDNSDLSSCRIIKADINHFQQMTELFKDAHTVFHTAAMVNSHASKKDYYHTNVTGTSKVCEAALQAGVARLIFVSTSDVFGLPSDNQIFDENSPFKKWHEKYADSKILATEMVRRYRSKGLNTTIIYPGWVYGAGDKQFVPGLLRQLKTGLLPIWLKTAGPLNLIHIDDLVHGLVLAGYSTHAVNQEYLMMDTDSVSLKEFCRRLGAAQKIDYRIVNVPYFVINNMARMSALFSFLGLAKTPLITTSVVKSFRYAFKFTTKKARRELNWQARVSLSEGLDDVPCTQRFK